MEGSGIEDGAMGSLSRGDPKTAGLLPVASALVPAELLPLPPVLVLVPLPQGMEFQIRAPGQQIAMV